MGRFRTLEDGPPRPYSDVVAERAFGEPGARIRELALEEIARLEGEAKEAADETERAALQCEAEALRASLVDAHTEKRR